MSCPECGSPLMRYSGGVNVCQECGAADCGHRTVIRAKVKRSIVPAAKAAAMQRNAQRLRKAR